MRSLLLSVFVVSLLVAGNASAETTEGFSLRYLPEATNTAPGAAAEDLPPVLMQTGGDTGERSPRRAILYSLLLPGAGDYYLGHTSRATMFFSAEAAIWTGFVISRIQGHRREDAYEEYSVQFAGVSRTGHSEDFYIALREYDSSAQYERELKQEARFELYPDASYEAMERYYLDNRVSDFEDWEWASFDDRVHFQNLRSDSKNAFRRSTWLLWGAAANRVASALVTMASLRSPDSGNDTSLHYRLDFNPPLGLSGYDAAIVVTRSF